VSKDYGELIKPGGRGKDGGDPEPIDPKEVVKKFNDAQAEIQKKQKELEDLVKLKDDAKADEIKALNDTITKSLSDLRAELDKTNERLMKQGSMLLLQGQKNNVHTSPTTFKQALEAAFEEKKAEIEDILKNGQKATLNVKVATTMSVEQSIGSGTTHVSITQDTGIFSPVRKRELTYRQSVSTGTIGTNIAMWIEETDEQGNPIFIGEGDGKTQSSVKYVEKTESVKKIAVYGKVTTEMLADIPQLVSYIQNNIMRRLDIATETKLISATGAGDDPKGAQYYASAFSAPSSLTGVNGVTNPNELDVMEAVALQCKLAYGTPEVIYINPATMSKIKLIKDSTDRPVWKDYITVTGDMVISGMRVIETTAITEGYFLGGQMSVLNLLIREEMGIQIGLDGNDYTQNKKTLLAEKRLVQFCSANDTGVIIQGDFATAKAAIVVTGS